MDLSFPPFDRAVELVAWPGDLAALMVDVAARQGASFTAVVQGGLPAIGAVDPAVSGQTSFNPAVAALLAAWTGQLNAKCLGERNISDEHVNDAFTAAGQGMFNALCQNGRDDIKPGTGAPIEEL